MADTSEKIETDVNNNDKVEEENVLIPAYEYRRYKKLEEIQTTESNKQIDFICSLIENNSPESENSKETEENNPQETSKIKEILSYMAPEPILQENFINPLYTLLKKLSEDDLPLKKRRLDQHQSKRDFAVTNTDNSHHKYLNLDTKSAKTEKDSVTDAMNNFFKESSNLY